MTLISAPVPSARQPAADYDEAKALLPDRKVVLDNDDGIAVSTAETSEFLKTSELTESGVSVCVSCE